MKVSVVGCGGISKCHFKALNEIENVTIHSAVDIKPERADAAAAEHGCKAYYSFEQMLEQDKPDCVHICTPHYLHVPMAVAALNAGVNVLCEKPCAVSADGLAQLRAAQSASGAQFGVCFQNRYNSSVKIIKDILDNHKYGAIKAVRASVHWCRGEAYYSDDWHGTLEKECGGVVINQAVHTLDLLRYLTGSDIAEIDAHVFNDHLKGIIEVEDTATARFVFANGIVGMFHATTAFGFTAPVMLDFFCEDALLRIEGDNAYCIQGSSVTPLSMATDGEFTGRSYWGRGHNSLIADFYDCLSTGRRFSPDAFEGGKAVEEFLAIYASSACGEKVYLTKD